mgnify:CR=1 FL=1
MSKSFAVGSEPLHVVDGVDFVFVDPEHTPIDRQTLSGICQTYQALGVPPVVRIASLTGMSAPSSTIVGHSMAS